MPAKADAIASACEALARGAPADAAEIIRSQYPFAGQPAVARRYSDATCMRVFLRDGFVDRYSGERLVFPGALRLLTHLLPQDFPCHPSWKMSETHSAFWELFPTIDHVVPVARGGRDSEDNWVTTSMSRNAAKGCSMLEEIGWQLLPPGDSQWDGLTGWCIDFIRGRPTIRESDPYVRRWHDAATRVRSGASTAKE
jgi:hypothetical protein